VDAAYRQKLSTSPVFLANHTNDPHTSPDQSASQISLEDFRYVPPSDTALGSSGESGILHAIRTQTGFAFLSSAAVPGSGQLVNRKYLRGALYLAVEAVAVYLHISEQNAAENQEVRYKEFANSNWSVINYAKWLVDYHDEHGITSDALDQLRNEVSGVDVVYGKNAWDEVPISTLRRVERQTPFVYTNGTVGNDFSHTMPDYGSQQYYELISKYFQYGPGWNDFDSDLYRLHWDGTDMPDNWREGARLADRFNESYRLSGHMFKLLVANHVISAFDSFFTVKLKQHKLNANATLLRGGGAVASVRYGF